MKKKGRFIVFEGIDGAGKSRQIEYTKAWFEKQGFEVVVTREPGGTDIGAKIRGLLLDPANDAMADLTELLLYAADRVQHIEETIVPALESRKVVLCDRFSLSTVAYQGYGRGLDTAAIEKLNALAVGETEPDLTFILDIKPQRARGRIAKNRGEAPDRLEQEQDDFFTRVRQGYLDNAHCCVVIDADREPDV
ncbi:MAG: dTMP kinase, partial [Bacillota bacterium]|nr:dTMP kinase [Bacillota bacterium]